MDMGIVALQQGDDYVIASDCDPNEIPSRRAPKRRSSAHHVWTGSSWSAVMSDAKTFASEENADEYLRSNYARVTGQR